MDKKYLITKKMKLINKLMVIASHLDEDSPEKENDYISAMQGSVYHLAGRFVYELPDDKELAFQIMKELEWPIDIVTEAFSTMKEMYVACQECNHDK